MEQKIYVVDCYGTKVFVKGYTEKEGREKLARACINFNIHGFEAKNIEEVPDSSLLGDFRGYEVLILRKYSL